MRYKHVHKLLLAIVTGFALMAGGPVMADSDMQSTDDGMSASQTDNMAASLSVSDQTVTEDTVVIRDVMMPSNGYVVIHAADADGKIKAPESIGHTMVEQGEHDRVSVKLDSSVKAGNKLFAMLHKDTGQAGEYEFADSHGQSDGAMKARGKPVIKSFMVE